MSNLFTVEKPASIGSFYEQPVFSFSAGPSQLDPRILLKAAQQAPSHVTPGAVRMCSELSQMTHYLGQLSKGKAFWLPFNGQLAVQTVLEHFVKSGDEVCIAQTGLFSDRIADIVKRLGGSALVIENTPGSPLDLARVEEVLKANSGKLFCFVAIETSNGSQSPVNELVLLAEKYGNPVIIDAVTMFPDRGLLFDKLGSGPPSVPVAIVSCGQKRVGGFAGTSPVMINDYAWEIIEKGEGDIVTWVCDIKTMLEMLAKRAYHFTTAMQALQASHEAMRILTNEIGLLELFKMQKRASNGFERAISAAASLSFVHPSARSDSLKAIKANGVSGGDLVGGLLNRGFETSAGGGGAFCRIGLLAPPTLMRSNIEALLSALARVVRQSGQDEPVDALLDAFSLGYDQALTD